MRSSEYHLYRIKFIKPAQVSLFDPGLTPRELFERGLDEKPYVELRQNNIWHIGNIEHITADAGRFAVGRITKAPVEKYDEGTGDFREVVDDSGPYTFVYFDAGFGVLGIGRKSRVANDVDSIASKIERLMQSTTHVTNNQIVVRVDKIRDPENFVQKIRGAYAVKKFKANFTGPNPVDADELFQKPLSYYCQQLNGDQGSVSVAGQLLNQDAVIAVAKSTAATGNAASAVILEDRGKPPVSISFHGDARKVAVDVDAGKDATLRAIQTAYHEVRGD